MVAARSVVGGYLVVQFIGDQREARRADVVGEIGIEFVAGIVAIFSRPMCIKLNHHAAVWLWGGDSSGYGIGRDLAVLVVDDD